MRTFAICAVALFALACNEEEQAANGSEGGYCRISYTPCNEGLVCREGSCRQPEDTTEGRRFKLEVPNIKAELEADGKDATPIRFRVTDAETEDPYEGEIRVWSEPPGAGYLQTGLVELDSDGVGLTAFVACDGDDRDCPAFATIRFAIQNDPSEWFGSRTIKLNGGNSYRSSNNGSGSSQGSGSGGGNAGGGGARELVDEPPLCNPDQVIFNGNCPDFSVSQSQGEAFFSGSGLDTILILTQPTGQDSPKFRVAINPRSAGDLRDLPDGEYDVPEQVDLGMEAVVSGRNCRLPIAPVGKVQIRGGTIAGYGVSDGSTAVEGIGFNFCSGIPDPGSAFDDE